MIEDRGFVGEGEWCGKSIIEVFPGSMEGKTQSAVCTDVSKAFGIEFKLATFGSSSAQPDAAVPVLQEN